MIEVVPAVEGWTWRMICAAGRVLVEAPVPFPCQYAAFADAKAYRARFWAHADGVDHRMGRAF